MARRTKTSPPSSWCSLPSRGSGSTCRHRILTMREQAPSSSSARRSPGSEESTQDASDLFWSAHIDGGVVDDERSLVLVILSADELQRDLLPGTGAQREAVPCVPSVGVEVGICVQRGRHLA